MGVEEKNLQVVCDQNAHCFHPIVTHREWLEESGAWMQYVSKEPATRLDVVRLQVCTLHVSNSWGHYYGRGRMRKQGPT